MFNVASDIHTRQTIWVARKVGQQQRNSHTCDILADGLSSADWAGLHTAYEGWQGTGPSLCDLKGGRVNSAPLYVRVWQFIRSCWGRVPPPFIFLWVPVSYKVLLSLAKCIRI